jgi:hypothetical protein
LHKFGSKVGKRDNIPPVFIMKKSYLISMWRQAQKLYSRRSFYYNLSGIISIGFLTLVDIKNFPVEYRYRYKNRWSDTFFSEPMPFFLLLLRQQITLQLAIFKAIPIASIIEIYSNLSQEFQRKKHPIVQWKNKYWALQFDINRPCYLWDIPM